MRNNYYWCCGCYYLLRFLLAFFALFYTGTILWIHFQIHTIPLKLSLSSSSSSSTTNATNQRRGIENNNNHINQHNLQQQQQQQQNRQNEHPIPSISSSTDHINNNDVIAWNQLSTFDKLPKWMKEYFIWHQQQRLLINEDNWMNKNHKYLFVLCLRTHTKCGGTADRLRPIPFLIRIAYETNRVLLIKWEKPAQLEEFLLPPINGYIDWRTPDYMIQTDFLRRNTRHNDDTTSYATSVRILVDVAYTNKTIVKSILQANDHGSTYYNNQSMKEYHHDNDNTYYIDDNNSKIEVNDAFRQQYHACWYSLFTPVPSLAQLIYDQFNTMQLIPFQYSFAHLRANYGLNEGKGYERRDPILVKNWTINSINCLSNIYPGGPYFFAADSEYAKDVAIMYGKERNIKIVTTQNNNKNNKNQSLLHLDLSPNWDKRSPFEYYPVFIDLYIMSFGTCMSYNMGGFGKWAKLISGQNLTCHIRHWTKGVNQATANKNGCTWTEPKHHHHYDEQQQQQQQQQQQRIITKLQQPLFLPPMD